ncbi:hypothetical protein Tco_0862200, partial [Tanacetum coccineum]
LKEWMKDKEDVKHCPVCRFTIEKIDGATILNAGAGTTAGPPLLSATTITAGPPAAVPSAEGLLQLQGSGTGVHKDIKGVGKKAIIRTYWESWSKTKEDSKLDTLMGLKDGQHELLPSGSGTGVHKDIKGVGKKAIIRTYWESWSKTKEDSKLDTLMGLRMVNMNFYPACPNPDLTVANSASAGRNWWIVREKKGED